MSTPETINLPTALAALETAVQEKGADHIAKSYDYVGTSEDGSPLFVELSREDGGTCRYRDPKDETNPSCIVGNALWQWGLLDQAKPYEGSTADVVLMDLGIHVTGDAIEVLKQAQNVQDEGRSWGDALMTAKSRCNRKKGV